MSADGAVLEARDVARTYRRGDEEVHALRGISLEIARGELVAVTGPSGSGKSTLLHVLGGLDRPDRGEVVLEGRVLSRLGDEDLAAVRRRRLGFVLQFFNLLPTLTALENVALPLLLDGAGDAVAPARAAMASVGLDARGDHRPAELSGGEQQRVALARALVAHPAVVLADEPTGSLDSTTGREILDLLRSSADSGQTIVLVTHDEHAAEIADRIVHIVDGCLV